MTKLAVDVVLLPPVEVMETAIALNQELLADNPGEIVLSEEGMLPHISMVMGTLRREDIGEVEKILQACAQTFPPLFLEVPAIHVRQSSKGHPVSSLDIAPSSKLQRLHEQLAHQLAKFLGVDAAPEMFHSSPTVAESSLGWVNHYLSDYSFENFWPHITLGVGELTGKKMRLRFTVGRLALCHLGNHCTCREILAEVVLKGKG